MQTPNRRLVQNPQYMKLSRKCDQKCVCQICTCGQHSCPQESVPFAGQTTHQRQFKPYKITPQRIQTSSYQPERQHYDPNVLKTSYQATYTPQPIMKNDNFKESYQYIPKRGQLSSQTEYSKSYTPYNLQAQKPTETYKYIPQKVKFEGTTTYANEYGYKNVQKQSPINNLQYSPNRIPFQGQSSYARDYKPMQIQSQIVRQQLSYEPKKVPFVGQSRYQEEYQAYNVEAKQHCAADYLPARPRRCSPGKKHLQYNAQKDMWE